MFELLTLLVTASNFASFLTGIAASHIANQIPRKNDFDGHAARCFEQAAERWRVVDEVHATLFPKVSTIEKWTAFISSVSEVVTGGQVPCHGGTSTLDTLNQTAA